MSTSRAAVARALMKKRTFEPEEQHAREQGEQSLPQREKVDVLGTTHRALLNNGEGTVLLQCRVTNRMEACPCYLSVYVCVSSS
jgi:hypothetical protein